MAENKLDHFGGNIHKLSGRQKGVKNKSTIERERLLEERLMKNDRIFKLVDFIFDGIEDGTLRKSEAVKAFSTFSAYLFRTLAERNLESMVENITSREDAENQVKELFETVSALRAVK